MATEQRRSAMPVSLLLDSNVSSPLENLSPAAGHHHKDSAGRISFHTIDEMYKILQCGRKDQKRSESLQIPLIEPDVSRNRRTRYCDYLNRLSAYIHTSLGIEGKGLIHFVLCERNAPLCHPSGAKISPDFIAMRKSNNADGSFYWSALEATGEIVSGEGQVRCAAQRVHYTEFLLQARPDYTSVLGIYVQMDSFKLVVTNACGAFCTALLKWEEPSSRSILCAWISRLYQPVKIDSSISLNIDSEGVPNFNITSSGRTYKSCFIRSVGSAFGRRTIVYGNPKSNFIIKEQYVKISGRYDEGPILETIHHGGLFPGVVRVLSREVVKVGEKDLVVRHENEGRKKIRLVMLDKGCPLMDASTPRDALIAIYNLLEVTRLLHRKCDILHRDISSNNVLLRHDIAEIQGPFAQDLGDMCFASYLLKEKSKNSDAKRLDTKLLLIDFDMSEEILVSQREGRQHTLRTGTYPFMARLVHSADRETGVRDVPPLPQMIEGLEAYEYSLRDRLEAFPPNEEELIRNKDPTWPSGFRHKLQYDAESTFWLLLYWTTLACPEYDTYSPDRFVPSVIWSGLTATGEQSDLRPALLYPVRPLLTHPAYGPLRPLLQDIAYQLQVDTDASTDPLKKNEEYLHEAMQRLVLEFLFKNYEADFWNLKKSSMPRQLEQQPEMHMSLPTGQIETLWPTKPSGSQRVQTTLTGSKRKWADLEQRAQMVGTMPHTDSAYSCNPQSASKKRK